MAQEDCFPMCSYLCLCINSCFDVPWEETIDYAHDGKLSANEFFRAQEKAVFWSTHMFRFVGIVLCVAGLWMVFTPLIVTLKWVPLIGFLLGTIASLASFFFSLVLGTALSVLVIATSWLCFRPFLALTLITITGIATFLVVQWNGQLNTVAAAV